VGDLAAPADHEQTIRQVAIVNVARQVATGALQALGVQPDFVRLDLDL
jgi:hypothetical protein